jgi:hypothetical protein
MTDTRTLIKQGRTQEVWTKYCGFFDLSPEEFREIQERLLLEQIELLRTSLMGRMLLGDVIPTSVEEFRNYVPITTYEDYKEFLDEKREDVLPRKPYGWSRTSGRSGEYSHKWIPYPQQMYEKLGEILLATMILSTCSQRGEVNIELNAKVLLATAPPPYVTSMLSRSIRDLIDLQFLPPLEAGEKMEFAERMDAGFKMAMRDGMDYFYGVSSVLVAIGERFEKGTSRSGFSLDMLHPAVLWRLIRSAISSRVKNRSILPKDLWKLKGIMVGGTDTDIYREKIKYYWGRDPINGYGSTEGGAMAIQAWNRKSMTFSPETNFLEFIPQDELEKINEDPGYQPKTLLYDELVPGIYELVFSNFHGGIYTRYRVRDMIEVVATRDDEVDINLPQFNFYSRSDGVINLAGFTYLTERDIWAAVESSGIEYTDWVARKETKDGRSHIHLFVELKSPKNIDPDKIKEKIDSALCNENSDYSDMKEILGYNALKLTLLNPGAFGNYMDYQQSQGADLAHTKPPHMKPTKEQLEVLLKDTKLK